MLARYRRIGFGESPPDVGENHGLRVDGLFVAFADSGGCGERRAHHFHIVGDEPIILSREDRDAHLQHRIVDADRRIGCGDVERGARHGNSPQDRLRAVVRVDLEITGGEPDVLCLEIEEKVSVVTRRARAEPHSGGAFVPRCIDVAHSKAAAPAAQVQ